MNLLYVTLLRDMGKAHVPLHRKLLRRRRSDSPHDQDKARLDEWRASDPNLLRQLCHMCVYEAWRVFAIALCNVVAREAHAVKLH